MADNKFRAAAYCRVSTFDQVTDVLTIKGSLEEQEERARKYVAGAGWEFVQAYVEPGISGEKYEERINLQKLLEDARSGNFDCVIIKAGDRLARDQEIYFKIVKILNQYLNVQILNLQNPTQIVPPADFNGRHNPMLAIQHGFDAMMAAFDQNRRTEMMMEGKKRQARAGRFISAYVMFGYQLQYKVVGGVKVERIPIPNPDEYWVIEMLPKLVLEEKLTDAEIIRRLESLGVKPRNSAHWNRTAIANLLSQSFYAGKIRYGRRALKLDPEGKLRSIRNPKSKLIFSDHKYEHPWSWETYEKIQNVRHKRAEAPPRQVVSRSPLAGVLMCGFCGRSMILRIGELVNGKQRSDIYSCGFHYQSPAACTPNRVGARQIFDDLIFRVERLKSQRDADPNTFYADYKVRDYQDHRDHLQTRLEVARRDLKEMIPSKEDRLNRGFLSGKVTDDQYAELSKIIGEDKDRAATIILEIEAELNKIKTASNQVDAMERFLADAGEFIELFRMPLSEWPEIKVRKAQEWIAGRYRSIRVMATSEGRRKPKTFEIYYEAVRDDI